MLTIGKCANLVIDIIDGDLIHGTTRDEDSSGISPFYKGSFHPAWTIKSFAWRPLNTLPDNPKFKYEIGGHMPQWRPLLDQSVKPDIKPVFTQEMADAGELPPVGSDFLHAKKVVTCLSVSDYDGGVVTFAYNDRDGQEVDIDCCWNNDSWVQPIDTRTPKQKAVDAACESINQDHNKLVIGLVSDLYDKGFIKC